MPLAAIALLAAGAWATAPPVQTLDLTPGTSETLVFGADVGAAFVANPETADVNVLDNRTLFVLGRAPGVTSLKVHDTAGGLLAAYAVRVHRQAAYAAAVVNRVAGEHSDIVVDSLGDALFVTGTAASPAQAEQVLRGIRAVSGDAPVVDALTLRSPAQVNLDVLISEVSRTVTQELGVDWSVDINPFVHPLRTWATGTGLRLGTGALQLANIYEQVIEFVDAGPGAPDGTNVTNQVSELGIQQPAVPRGGDGGMSLAHGKEVNSGKYRATAFLEALAQNGLVVVHARPSLTTVSGQRAEFFSGLEIPVPTISEGVVGTVYRQTGVSLLFTPTVLANDQISLSVQPRIREIAGGGANIAGTIVPNINERSAATTVELGDGESIAIAGLYRRNTTASETGIPLLKDIPVWGALFRTTGESDRSVELIIVVTARIVSAVPRFATEAAPGPADSALTLDNEFRY